MSDSHLQNIDARLLDHARNILEVWSDRLPREVLARLWDEYHSSRTSRDLARRLAGFGGAPHQVKDLLIAARRLTDPDSPSQPVATVVKAILKLRTIPTSTLALVEKHPALSKMLVDAALHRQ